MSAIDRAIKSTEMFLGLAQDPGMLAILPQLKAMKEGRDHNYTVSRIIAYNYTPAPTAEIEAWADECLAAHEEFKATKK